MLPTIHAVLTDGMQSITAEAKVRRAGWGARRWTISLSAAVGSQIHSDLKQWGAWPSGCSNFRLLPKFQSVRNERDSIIASVILSPVAAQNHAGSPCLPARSGNAQCLVRLAHLLLWSPFRSVGPGLLSEFCRSRPCCARALPRKKGKNLTLLENSIGRRRPDGGETTCCYHHQSG
jgi:hypothetical protein